MQEWILARFDEIQDILDQRVLVLFRHARNVVRHFSCIMLDEELLTSHFKVGVASEHRGTLDKRVVGSRGIGMGCRCGVVQSGEDTCWTLILDERAHDGVVKVCAGSATATKGRIGRTFDGRPLDLLANIFLLLGLERQFDKDLLQLFIDIVDAELRRRVSIRQTPVHAAHLLKAIVLENLKPTTVTVSSGHRRKTTRLLDIQHTNDVFTRPLRLHGDVHSRNDPFKQVVIPGQA